MGEKTGIVTTRSNSAGHVGLSIRLKCSGLWNGDSARIAATTKLTIQQARELAASLIECADREQAKEAAKVAAKERRRKWRDREIAAGRLVVLGR